ncbi:6674_t:CDS:1, partial [Ambispora leptoticha]
YRNEKSEIQVGVQIPKFGVNIGITKKNETTTLDEYAQSHQETKLGQKLINKELQLQETEEQNQQAQIEHSPK